MAKNWKNSSKYYYKPGNVYFEANYRNRRNEKQQNTRLVNNNSTSTKVGTFIGNTFVFILNVLFTLCTFTKPLFLKLGKATTLENEKQWQKENAGSKKSPAMILGKKYLLLTLLFLVLIILLFCCQFWIFPCYTEIHLNIWVFLVIALVLFNGFFGFAFLEGRESETRKKACDEIQHEGSLRT